MRYETSVELPNSLAMIGVELAGAEEANVLHYPTDEYTRTNGSGRKKTYTLRVSRLQIKVMNHL
jgi:hypothetical protein